MVEDLRLAICKSLANTLQLPVQNVPIESSMATLEQWDSLQHINVIVDIEEQFQVSFSPEEVTQLNSVEAIYRCLTQKMAS